MRPAEHRAAHEQLARSDGDGGRVVLATGRYIGEGFDDPRLDALLLAMPIAWKGTVVHTQVACTAPTPASTTCSSTTTSTPSCQCCGACSPKRLRAYRSLGYELAATVR
jgi:hypothetical protein